MLCLPNFKLVEVVGDPVPGGGQHHHRGDANAGLAPNDKYPHALLVSLAKGAHHHECGGLDIQGS